MEEILQKKIGSLTELGALRTSIIKQKDSNRTCISICAGTGCRASGAQDIIDAFCNEIEKRELELQIELKETGCHGFCERGPLVVIRPRGILYQNVTPQDVSEIVVETILQNKIIDRLTYIDPDTNQRIVYESDIPFYKKQTRLIFGANGEINPSEIDDYIAIGGYTALGKALSMQPLQLINEITLSGLRGRGGGGFSTGKKWQSCRDAEGDVKYVICNADEGDPGCYQDRSLLEGNPHSVIEGMIIGAYAIGAKQGYIYVRNEYPLALKHARIAIQQARDYGLLGTKILGTDFEFDISINRGGGAFICGESSALIASLEGDIGEPRPKYVHMSEHGLWNNPSLLNNVKTWANVTLIINKGAEWYSQIGTESSKGTMVFSLVGKITNTGLVEVPMGITLREMIYEIGGGIRNGKKFKAVQTGGPSGGVIPEKYLDTPIDYDELSKLGSMMGSGGMIVMDEDTCMVDIARYFVDFLMEESCGKCIPCREGLQAMNHILTKITEGNGKEEDLSLLKELCDILKNGSFCALGQTAPNPVKTTLEHFYDEYMAHIKDRKCPAGVCKNLVTYKVDNDKCKACLRCIKECPTGAIKGEKKKPESIAINQGLCIKCGACYDICKFEAIVRD